MKFSCLVAYEQKRRGYYQISCLHGISILNFNIYNNTTLPLEDSSQDSSISDQIYLNKDLQMPVYISDLWCLHLGQSLPCSHLFGHIHHNNLTICGQIIEHIWMKHNQTYITKGKEKNSTIPISKWEMKSKLLNCDSHSTKNITCCISLIFYLNLNSHLSKTSFLCIGEGQSRIHVESGKIGIQLHHKSPRSIRQYTKHSLWTYYPLRKRRYVIYTKCEFSYTVTLQEWKNTVKYSPQPQSIE